MAVMPLVTSFSVDYKEDYRGLITHEDVTIPSPWLWETTAMLLARKLPKLPTEQRKEPWVINAVEVIARVRHSTLLWCRRAMSSKANASRQS